MKTHIFILYLLHLALLQSWVAAGALGGVSWPVVPPSDVELLEGYDNGRSSDSVLETHSISGRGFLKTVRNRRRAVDTDTFANQPDDLDVSARFEEQYEIARVKREAPVTASSVAPAENSENVSIQRSPRGTSRQEWMKQPLPVEYPTLDDQEAAAANNQGAEARAPSVNFITRKLDTAESRDQRESSVRPRVAKPLRTDIRMRPYYDDLPYDPLYDAQYDPLYDGGYYEPPGYRRRARYYDERPPPSMMYDNRYDNRFDRYDSRYDTGYDRYDRYDNRRFDAYRRNDEVPPSGNRQRRIIYYATLPEPGVYRQMYGQRRYDAPDRDRYPPSSSYGSEPRRAALASHSANERPREMLREAQPQTQSQSQSQSRSQKTPNPVRVSATVGVRDDARDLPQQRFIASQDSSPIDYSQPVSFQVVEDARAYPSQRN